MMWLCDAVIYDVVIPCGYVMWLYMMWLCDVVIEEDEEDPDGYTYADMIKRDERRWHVADQDNDGKLSKEEYANFLHPEEAAHMREIVIEVSLLTAAYKRVDHKSSFGII